MSSDPREQAARRAWPAGLAVLALLALLTLAHTWPLAAHWNQSIPYVYHPSPGWELVPQMPGDHLQFYYWSWLFTDNVTGPSSFPSNPYEFNTFLHPQGIALYANFPFSLFYLALKPLGALSAYNAVVLLTYLLAGMAAFALARRMLGSSLAALPVALIYALLPFRASQALSGHLYGFIAFMLPATLWCLEKGWAKGSAWWGALGGLLLLAVGLMEGHLLFYTTLLMGLYLPLRLLTLTDPAEPGDAPQTGGAASAWWVAGAGLALGLSLHLAAGRGDAALSGGMALAVSLSLGLVLLVCLWLTLAELAARLTSLGLAASRDYLARGLAPLLLSPLYAVQYWLDVPHLGKALIAALLLWGAWRALPALWRARRWPGFPRGTWPPLIALGIGWGLGAAAMMVQKARVLDESIASQGRSLGEVKLFAPNLADLFQLSPAHSEQVVYLGLVTLVLAGAGLLLLALGRRDRGLRAPAALWAVLGVLAALLCLGPNLPQMPLYNWLYQYMPFFNYPRVPGRLVIFAVLFLGLLGGWTLKELAKAWGGGRMTALVLALAVILGVAWDFRPARDPGLCLMPPPGPLAAAVKGKLPTGPDAKQRLLGLPIWPGDSHQSSVYELLISQTRAVMVNGYSPQAPQAYVDQVFWPLYSLDFGLVTPQAWDTLKRLKVGLVAFYEDEEVYTRKVCPFPPELARRRLTAGGRFQAELQAGNVWLLRPRDAAPDPAQALAQVSPVTSWWDASWLPGATGRLVEDKNASGWGLLFEEAATWGGPLGPRMKRPAGNVAQAKAGGDAPGWLARGPGRPLPPGSYVARLRLRRGPGGMPGRVEAVDKRSGKMLASLELSPALLPDDHSWHDVALPFTLEGLLPLELRVWFSGQADLALDVALINFAGMERPQAYYPASRLWRQAGELVADPQAPTGLAVRAKPGWTPPLYLMHGPQQTYPPGRYVARFRLAAPAGAPPEALLAQVTVATDLGRLPLATAQVHGRDLGGGYRDIELSFELKRRCELGLRVRYAQGGEVRVAGASVTSSD
ncbi:MAG: hypothetical protein KMY53_00650 [Desulfarculus sp.]|nr:hypothetical protein [Pseudomonadota bacterium]MBV1715147.1 hypothetical protein [Desulfarculus sp.]MBU4575706.1 hypothetical protein [Pseudomonadota bacterium]MBU4598831.1 hypothetical protein [Pseudomonadota bacterium]MBV1736645.1 hypothetical protein [Desulfarculus sp.]